MLNYQSLKHEIDGRILASRQPQNKSREGFASKCSMFDFEYTIWLGLKNAGAYCDRFEDWVGIYARPWTDEEQKGQIRFKYEGRDRRYWTHLAPLRTQKWANSIKWQYQI